MLFLVQILFNSCIGMYDHQKLVCTLFSNFYHLFIMFWTYAAVSSMVHGTGFGSHTGSMLIWCQYGLIHGTGTWYTHAEYHLATCMVRYTQYRVVWSGKVIHGFFTTINN